MGKHKSTDYKLSAVEYYLNNYKNISLRDTCKIYKCSKYSLVRWVRRYIKYGTVENKHRKEGSYKITKSHVNFIIDLIKLKPFITLTDILGYFHKKFNDIKLSKTHLSNIIKYANLTYKKVQITHKPDTRYNQPINYKEEYKKFYSKIKKYNLDNIISIDETSISIGLHISRGRKEIGKRLNKITKDNKVFVKYTLIMAITNKGVLDWILYEKGGSDHCRFIEFLKRFLVNRKKKLILMDNASCHRNQLVKNYIIQSENDYLHILPYCHYLNPIEKLFNQLKHYMKKDEPMSYNLIKVSINKSIKNIKLKTFENYFKSSLIKTKDDIIKNKTKYIKKPKIYKE
jgi:transposase